MTHSAVTQGPFAAGGGGSVQPAIVYTNPAASRSAGPDTVTRGSSRLARPGLRACRGPSRPGGGCIQASIQITSRAPSLMDTWGPVILIDPPMPFLISTPIAFMTIFMPALVSIVTPPMPGEIVEGDRDPVGLEHLHLGHRRRGRHLSQRPEASRPDGIVGIAVLELDPDPGVRGRNQEQPHAVTRVREGLARPSPLSSSPSTSETLARIRPSIRGSRLSLTIPRNLP